MNKINLIQLLIIAANAIFGIIAIIISAFDGSLKGNVGFLIGLASYAGVFFVLWILRGAILGKTVLSFIIFAFAALVAFWMNAMINTVVFGLVFFAIDILYAAYLFISLKKSPEE